MKKHVFAKSKNNSLKNKTIFIVTGFTRSYRRWLEYQRVLG
jgi:hypothetical protein